MFCTKDLAPFSPYIFYIAAPIYRASYPRRYESWLTSLWGLKHAPVLPIGRGTTGCTQFSVHVNLVFLYYTRISYYTKYNPLFLNYTVRYIATNLKHRVVASHCFCPTCTVLDARVHWSLLPNLTSASRGGCWVAFRFTVPIRHSACLFGVVYCKLYRMKCCALVISRVMGMLVHLYRRL